MADRLANKVAIVTGGGTGIGRAIAVLLSREGARVAICGRTLATLEETARQIRSGCGEVEVIRCDVSDSQSVESMVAQTVERFGRVDILVNNAGVRANSGTILEVTEEEWDRVLDIDAKGSFLCSKYAIPSMKQAGGGSIIMISSISAHVGQRGHVPYNAAKAAQELMMKSMALELAPDNIRVNSICPAWVTTELNREQLRQMREEPEKIFPPGLSWKKLLELHPLGRIGTPDDVAWAAVYLASDEATWVTGTSLFVDGGYTSQ